MIGYFSTEPLANLFEGNPHTVALSLEDLEAGRLPKTDVLFLPEYYNLDEETTPFDLNTGLVGLNEIIYPDLARLPDGCFYVNGWPRPEAAKEAILEVAGPESTVLVAQKVLSAQGFQVVLAPATPGLLSARVVAMIINEAHLLLQEGMAQAADIDLSMKLGTGYPLGPFAWEQLWGEGKTKALLSAMAEREPQVVKPYFTKN
jgi:3-hydroxybutyryl-CoA dehydrogenase